MKLFELKSALIEQFFTEADTGVLVEDLVEILENLKMKSLLGEETRGESSAEPSKAFKKFTDGRRSTLVICEDEDLKKLAIFTAVRIGKKVAYVDLTSESLEVKTGTLSSVKNALKQAKNFDDDVYFQVYNSDQLNESRLTPQQQAEIDAILKQAEDDNKAAYAAEKAPDAEKVKSEAEWLLSWAKKKPITKVGNDGNSFWKMGSKMTKISPKMVKALVDGGYATQDGERTLYMVKK